MLDTKNVCKHTFDDFQKYHIKQLSDQIPEGRKLALAEEILARANLTGCENEHVLQLALAHLNGEKPKRRPRVKSSKVQKEII